MYGDFHTSNSEFKKIKIEEDNIKYSREFKKLIQNEYAYTFLVYEDFYLEYINEDGNKFEAKLK